MNGAKERLKQEEGEREIEELGEGHGLPGDIASYSRECNTHTC